ncbi:MAG: GTP pyrophosphokinase family protein [Bacilli bacterium]|nr:GTP pyrophosphokinase family protein [Bacilli bacterium]
MNLMLKYNMAMEVLCNDIDTLIKEYVNKNNYNPVNHIEHRIKTLKSAYDKLEKKGYELTDDNLFTQIRDMVGYRIICNFLSEVEDVVKLIESSKQLRIISRKDYITHPKDSGYLSYHLIVEVPIYLSTGIEYITAEIQIRTLAMNFWAALDHKIQYKFPGEEIPTEVADELYDISVKARDLDTRMVELNEIMNKYKD